MRLIIREDLDTKMPYRKAISLSLKDGKMWVSGDDYSVQRQMLIIKAVHAFTEHHLGFGYGLVLLPDPHGLIGLQRSNGTM